MKRALLLVLDSVGCGHAPDAAEYGDEGANTLGHILERVPDLELPNLRAMGLAAALDLAAGRKLGKLPDRSMVGVMSEASSGKDTTTGHWELAGVELAEAFATFERFPAVLVDEIEGAAGVSFLGNYAASGTEILSELGAEHVATGRPILYTSADSVLQIAAHEEVVPLEKLDWICEVARGICDRWRIGRVIARPFVGSEDEGFRRTANRHDYSLEPPRTILDRLVEVGVPVVGVGKISDIFAGRGVTESHPTRSNADGMAKLDELWLGAKSGLVFANLVDFDMLYGHRRDVAGYADALREFDAWLGDFLRLVDDEDLVIVTADHGNDPTWKGTDHTRERVPIFVQVGGRSGSLGVRSSFGDVAATLAEFFGLEWEEGEGPRPKSLLP